MNAILKSALVALAFATGAAVTTSAVQADPLIHKPYPGLKGPGLMKPIKPIPGLKGPGLMKPIKPIPGLHPGKPGHGHGHGGIDIDVVIGGGYGGGYGGAYSGGWGCSRNDALWKAGSIGVRNRWVQSVGQRNIVVRGTISGDPVRVVMKRSSPRCQVRALNYL